MATRLTKPWRPVDEIEGVLKGHLGVYQLANADDEIVYIGFAGGASLYGLKGEVSERVAELEDATQFRVEITASYMSRWRELMMVHIADTGESPRHNPPVKLGRMSPGHS